MIVNILVNGKQFGVDVYENNFDGKVQVNDTFHCEAHAAGRDVIFGTLDEQIVVQLPVEELKEALKPLVIKELIDDTIDTLRSRREPGDTYTIDDAYEYTADTLSELKWNIANGVDKIMTEKYTLADNLTVVDEILVDCPHKCGDCIGTEYYGQECIHGCDDCGYFDGSNCVHSGSYNCGNCGDKCAYDCCDWDNGE